MWPIVQVWYGAQNCFILVFYEHIIFVFCLCFHIIDSDGIFNPSLCCVNGISKSWHVNSPFIKKRHFFGSLSIPNQTANFSFLFLFFRYRFRVFRPQLLEDFGWPEFGLCISNGSEGLKFSGITLKTMKMFSRISDIWHLNHHKNGGQRFQISSPALKTWRSNTWLKCLWNPCHTPFADNR